MFNSSSISSNNINNTIIGSSAITMSTIVVSAYDFENVYYYKRKKAAPRIKSNSKKKAKEKAFLKGVKDHQYIIQMENMGHIIILMVQDFLIGIIIIYGYFYLVMMTNKENFYVF